MLERFGKSFKDILGLKSAFFEENDGLLKKAIEYSKVYTTQPARKRCKLCNETLPVTPSFTKHDVPYVICCNCTHLNGMHEDTDFFCEKVYTSDHGREYAKTYSASDIEAYQYRANQIYKPKAEFLLDALKSHGVDPFSMTYADMGTGAGYFVSAMQDVGINKIIGYDVNVAQIQLGKGIMPDLPINLIGLKDNIRICREHAADVISFIGVFEHLQDLRAVLKAVRDNKKINYIYFSVPMFSPCVFSEMMFPEIFPRHLAIGHTHLFTNESIYYFENEFDFERIGAWWFGTDMMDYYRSIAVSLKKDPNKTNVTGNWEVFFSDIIDDAQLAIDRKRKSSEVHMALRIKR